MINRDKYKVNPWGTILVVAGLLIAIGIYVYYIVANHLEVESSAKIISVGSIIAFFSLLFNVWQSYGVKKTAAEAMDMAKIANKELRKIDHFYNDFDNYKSIVTRIRDEYNDKNLNFKVVNHKDKESLESLYNITYRGMNDRLDNPEIMSCIRTNQHILVTRDQGNYTDEQMKGASEALLDCLNNVEI